MDVIRHHDISVQRAQTPRICNMQLFRDQARNLRQTEIDGPNPGRVQQSVESDECLARSCVLASENALLREASPQTPGHKGGQSRNIYVRETTAILPHSA